MTFDNSNLKVAPGDGLSARRWNELVDRVQGTASGFSPGGNVLRSLVRIKNMSGSDRDIGEILVLDEWDGPDGTSAYDIPENIRFTAIDPVWHTKIAKAVVLAEPIADGEPGIAVVRGICVIKCNEADEGYAMIKKDTINEFAAADAGIARVLARVESSEYCVADFRSEQNLWQYELNESSQAPDDTTAKLVKLDGTEFADEVEISDPLSLMDDQGSGDTGFCILSGDKFHAIQAPCGS